MGAAKNILHTSLENDNPVLHPAISLLNAASIERDQGNFNFYEDGVTSSVWRLINAIDQERIAIGQKLNLDIIPELELNYLQGYMDEPTFNKGFSGPGFNGIQAQSSLDHRYFHEDVGFGLVFLQSLGEQLGMGTSYISAVIRLASVLMQRDYLAEGKRTMASLGLSGYTGRELEELFS